MPSSSPPGASPEPTSRSMASGQVSPSHSHVFYIRISIPLFPFSVVTGGSEGIGRGYALEVGIILGGCSELEP